MPHGYEQLIHTSAVRRSMIVCPYCSTTALHSWLTTPVAPIAWLIIVTTVYKHNSETSISIYIYILEEYQQPKKNSTKSQKILCLYSKKQMKMLCIICNQDIATHKLQNRIPTKPPRQNIPLDRLREKCQSLQLLNIHHYSTLRNTIILYYVTTSSITSYSS